MKSPLALLAALSCAAVTLCGSAHAQQTAKPPATGAPRASTPARPNARTSRETAGARAARSAPVYRVELVVFRATSGLGAPEDWALESGTAAVTSTDADPGAAEPSGAQAGGAQTNGVPSSGAQASSVQTSSSAPSDAPAGGGGPGAAQASSAAPNAVVRLLTAPEFALDGVASRLRASGRYVPVAHIAWVQTASPWGKPVEIPVQSVGLDAQGITGTVALERGVFLHLALDLRYAMSDPPSGLDAAPGTVFVLDESQRVRLKERSYFDHPAFGVIALVTSDQTPSRAAARSDGGPATP